MADAPVIPRLNSPLRAVVFDLDGLMFNTEELYQDVGSEMLRRRGKSFDAELLDRMMGRPAPVALQMMIDYHQLSSTVEELVLETDTLFEALLNDRLALMPGLLPLLARLESLGLPKSIATSSGPVFTHDVLDRFQLRPRFQFILTAADITHGKPNPDVYLLAASKFGVAPGEMLVFEDSQNGCRAAVAAGAVAVAVPGGHSLRHDFAGAAMVADSLADPRIAVLLEQGRAPRE